MWILGLKGLTYMYQRSPLGSILGTYLYMEENLLTFAAFSAFVDICQSLINPFDCNSIIEVLIRTKGTRPCNVEVP